MANINEEGKLGQNMEKEVSVSGVQKKTGTSNRGFASMDPERQRAIASEGGRAAHASGNAHEFSSEEAREAGRKGGESRGRNSKNRNNNTGAEHRLGGRTE